MRNTICTAICLFAVLFAQEKLDWTRVTVLSDGTATYDALPQEAQEGQTTAMSMGDLPNHGAITGAFTKVSIDDDFRMFAMYKPAGSGSIWVTLWQVDWGWYAAAARTSGFDWMENVFESTPGTRGPVTTDSTLLPEWSAVATTK